jgi:hypothetical protein
MKAATLILLLLGMSYGVTGHAAPDPKKVMGPDECGECHKAEVRAWKKTHHSQTYRKMHRSKDAKKISKNLGIKRIKSESDCLTCHYTSIEKGGKEKVIAGISCESCHSPAKEWMDVHNDYGGKDIKREQEKPEHKKQRIAKMEKLGMIRPSHLYRLASNCFQCHTVPNEKLVNEGGHAAGSDFELVAWSQGEVRHNYMRSDDGKHNIESSNERKRLMYVTGAAVELEYALRGVAKATVKADYAVKMAKRVKAALARLQGIKAAVAIPEVDQMIAAGDAVSLKLNNEKELVGAAEKVSALTRKFLDSADGSKLAGLDKLLPTEYKGTAAN